MARPRRAVQAEIQQSKPFRSKAQEATIALLRTASVVSRGIARVLEPYALTLAQYNALRIIRGAGPQGIPTLDVRERMVEQGTPITRILDRLEESGYVRRDRAEADRRQVLCYLTPSGEKLLRRLDPIVNEADDAAMTALSEAEAKTLIALLDAVRRENAARGEPRTMVPKGRLQHAAI
jgi:MarR family transcriptional regulator, organic hydroperoxide resistance regulator